MSNLHIHDTHKAKPTVAIEIKGCLEDANDGELVVALALLLNAFGLTIADEAWNCWHDLSARSINDRVNIKRYSLESLFAVAQAASNGSLSFMPQSVQAGVGLEGEIPLLGIVVRLRAHWQHRGALNPLINQFVIDDLPVLAIRHAPLFTATAPATLLIETNWVWDNVMMGLSLEDAAKFLGYEYVSYKDRPERNKGQLEDVYTLYETYPGCAAHLLANGGTPEEVGKMLFDTSVKAVDILIRRLDIARDSVFDGKNKMAILLNKPTTN